MDNNTKGWLTEVCEECGSAFSMKLVAKLHEERTRHQRIEIFETQAYGTVMVIDGFVMLTDADNFIYHEMMTHPALFSHPNPARVLIIGGGDCGVLYEVLKHPEVNAVSMVEIDERVTRLAERFFPRLCQSNADARARFHFEDAIEWVKQTRSDAYDIVIIDSTDPIGPAEGLYTEAFYRDCFRILGAGGLVVHQSESPLFHTESIIKPMRSALVNAGFYDCKTMHFPQCTYPTGWWTATLACKGQPVTFPRAQTVAGNIVATRYYNADIHRASMAVPEFLKHDYSFST